MRFLGNISVLAVVYLEAGLSTALIRLMISGFEMPSVLFSSVSEKLSARISSGLMTYEVFFPTCV